MLRRNRLGLCVLLAVAALPAISANLPRKARDLRIEMPSGPAIKLSQYAGKPVVVALILTTCPHCQNTVVNLTGMQREYGARGLQVVAAAVESDGRSAAEFARQFGTNFPVGYITRANTTTWLDFMQHPTMQTPRMPMLAFIDRNGMIRTQHDAADPNFWNNEPRNLRTEIEALLGSPTPGGAKKAPAKAASKKKD